MKKVMSVATVLMLAHTAAHGQAPPRAPTAQTRAPTPVKPAPPPALPGSRAEPAATTPADKASADMPPNEALFDAINRGDLPTAKESLNRGADLNARNVLGLTPLDLAIDLGRNQISFLLLSLRGGAGYSTSGPPPDATPPGRMTRAQRVAAARASRATQSDDGMTAVAARPPAAAVLAIPSRVAGTGGAPVPQAGFMGFDTNARR